MPLRGKVIITCAVTGSIHTPTMSPYLPLTPDEIARDAIAAAEAGAAILHLHARDPKDGRPTPDPDVFMQFLPRIKQSTDAVINITTGGGHGMTLEERLAAPLRAEPEMCSLNMGSMNFGLFPMLGRYKDWKYEWEPQHLENDARFHFPQYLHRYRANPEGSGGGVRHPVRVRMLRCRPPLQSRAFSRPRAGQAAAIRADDFRHSRRYRRRSGKPRPHEAHRRQAVRRLVRVVDPRRRPPPDAAGDDGRDHGRQCPGRARGFAVDRQRQARHEQCRSGQRASARSSKTCRSRSPRPTRRGRCSRSRAATRSRSDRR